MAPACCTILIPAPVANPPPPVLASLARELNGRADCQVLLATGRQPAIQRNRALARARGEIIIFLDSDCLVPPGHINRLLERFDQSNAALAGGPLLLPPGAPPLQHVFQAVLAHPLVVGKTRARYAPVGAPRPTGEAEIILANMAARRTLFDKFGGFDERLYPNEENEWMDRVQQSGASLWYDPSLAVHREQRRSLRAFLYMLLRYGAGRARQAWVARRLAPAKHAPALALLAAAAAFILAPLPALALAAAAWAAFSLAVAATMPGPPAHRLAAGLLAPCVPLFYGLGQWLAPWLGPAPPDKAGPVEIIEWTPQPAPPNANPQTSQ